MSRSLSQHASLQGARIAVSGATGLVGRTLSNRLMELGAETIRMSRSPSPSDERQVQWDPNQGLIQPEKLEGVTAVVHLAGEGIADGRWTEAKKQRIRDSRVVGTRSLCESLSKLTAKPQTLVCASAIGFYGDRGDERLDEESSPGDGFLPEVCIGWEQACDPARAAGIRVVNIRIGVIISKDGGALAKMLLPFQLGMGGKIGSGQQYMSWVALDDVVGAIVQGLTQSEMSGPVNAVSPNPVTNAEFTKTLGSVLHRPTILPMPAFAAKLALGQMAEDLLLASTRVYPERLSQLAYRFAFADLHACLSREVG
ncbi:MAG: TIGR01777 family oxidoreductase [Planctomycetaceae bacterium]